jgi:alanine dehydrogenase
MVISNRTVKKNLPYEDLIEKLEDVFISYEVGETNMPPKQYLDLEDNNGDFRSMPARVVTDDIDVAGIKWISVYPDNPEKGLDTVLGRVILNNVSTGETRKIIEAEELTGRRTGSVAGLSTKYLSKEDSEVLGLVGLGEQSYHQYNSIKEVRDINKVIGIDPRKNARKKLEETISVNVETFEDDYSELQSCDIISTITPVEEPIISLGDLSENVHINSMGADSKFKQEFTNEVHKNSKVIVDDYEQCLHSGEISVSGRNVVDHSLGEYLILDNDYRDQRSIFDSTGLAIQDMTAAYIVQKNI